MRLLGFRNLSVYLLLLMTFLPAFADGSNIPHPSDVNPQPDLLIKGASESDTAYQTDNMYQQVPSDTQIKTIESLAGEPACFQIKLQNDSNTPQSFCLKTEENTNPYWTVDYVLDENSRIITTYAGGGSVTADGTDAKSYQFDSPYSIASDNSGNTYIGGHGYIWKIDIHQKVTCIAGNGGMSFYGDGGQAVNATLSDVRGIAIDANNNLYFSDSNYYRVRCIDGRTGIITTIAGNGTDGFSGDGGLATKSELNKPYGIVLDSSGNIYIADSYNNRIRKIDASTQIISTFAGNGAAFYNGDNIPALEANIPCPNGLAIDSSGNFYFLDYNSHLRKINTANGLVQTIAGNGSNQHSGDGGPATQAGVSRPLSICLDSESNIYFAEQIPWDIRKIDSKTGIITVFAGDGDDGFSGDGGPALQAEIGWVGGLLTRGDGYLTIVDSGNNLIRRVETPSIFNALAFGGYTTSVIPSQGSIVMNVTLTPDLQTPGDSEKSVVVKAYSDHSSDMILDSVKAVADLPVFGLPDLSIRKQSDPDTSYLGDGTYQKSPADAQVLTQNIPQGASAKFRVRIQNKGNQSQSFILKSTEKLISGWTSTYSLNGANIKTDLVGTGYTTPILSPKGILTFDIIETPDSTAAFDTPSAITINAYKNENNPAVQDSVQASASILTPDLMIKGASDPDADYQTDNVYQKIPGGSQIKTIETVSGRSSDFKIRLQNDSDISQSYYLEAMESADTEWTVNYTLDDNSRYITTCAGGGYGATEGTDESYYYIGLPYCVAFDHQGNLYAGGYHYIWKIDAYGKVTKIAGDGTNNLSPDGELAVNTPVSRVEGIAFDKNDNLYFSDADNYRVRRINTLTGIITTIAGNNYLGSSGDGGLATQAELAHPTGITFDSSGNLFISDTYNDVIRKVDAVTQKISTYAGSNDGSATSNADGILATKANLRSPSGISIDSTGDLYIAETNRNRIRKVDHQTGIITAIAGNGFSNYSGDGGSATEAGIPFPEGICIDKDYNIYISEPGYIREIDAKTGIITTVTGNGTSGYSGDGGPSVLAAINNTNGDGFADGGLITDNDGAVYIADTRNYRIRRIESADVIQDSLLFGGYTTPAIPKHEYILIDTALIPNTTQATGSQKSVTFQAYNNNTDTAVKDSVEALAVVAAIKNYTAPVGFIHNGWNLISLPADPVNPDPLTVFAGIDVANSSFQYWNNEADPCVFKGYGSAFGWTGPVIRGTPYWFICMPDSASTSISYQGMEPTTNFEMTIPAHTTAPYWIAVGTPFPSAVSADAIRFKDVVKRGDTWLTWADAYSSANSDLRIVDSSMQGWDASQDTFERLAPSAFTSPGDKTQFDPWWGYWLLVMDPNELKIQFPKPVQ